jgi:hypothetical protein
MNKRPQGVRRKGQGVKIAQNIEFTRPSRKGGSPADPLRKQGSGNKRRRISGMKFVMGSTSAAMAT